MRTLVRLLVYAAGMLGGLLCMYMGVHGFLFDRTLDERSFLVFLTAGIVLVLLGTEASERLKR